MTIDPKDAVDVETQSTDSIASIGPADNGETDDNEEVRRPLTTKNASDHRHGETMISPHRALMSLVKSMVGPGCLSLPYGWKQGGLWTSFVLSVVISLLNLHCSLQLIHTAQHLCRVSNRESLDYGHFAKKVFDHGPSERLRKRSKTMMYIANAANIFYQLGVCAIQIVFVATNLQEMVKVFQGSTLDMRVYATIVLVPVVCVNLIRELRVISVLAGFANFILLFGLIIILQECVLGQRIDTRNVKWSTSFYDTMFFIGTAMYTFEGQAAMLPMENKLKNPMEMTQNCGVLPTTMGFVSVIFVALGFFGFLAYGENIKGTITLNMPTNPFYQIINMTLVIAAYIGHVVNLYVVIAMLWPGIKRKGRLRWPITFFAYEIHLEILFRISLVLATYIFAVLVPRIELMIPLIGITAGIMIAFIFPPFFEILTFWHVWTNTDDTSRWYFYWKIVTNVSLIIFGLFIMLFGTYQNIYAIYTTIYQ